jgi:sialate O-acetylesterase
MKIEMGLFDHMVVQRNRSNVSEASFSGTCATSGPVMATVRRGRQTLKGFANLRAGAAARGKLHGCIKGLPVGGPYEIELKVGDKKLTVKDLLVGDVWLLGGQSNMHGCGLFPEKRLPVNSLVRAFYMDDRWAPAQDPVHNMWQCVDAVHIDLNGGAQHTKPDDGWGVCPGPAFGNEMRRLTGGVPQGLIACAHGGTSMTQWDHQRKCEGGKSLYGALVRRVLKNGRRVAGLVWYQGCSDANPVDARLYTQRMRALVAALRRDCGNKELHVAIVQIARVIGWSAETLVPWNSIQDQQRRLPKAIKHLTTVPVIDLALDDVIHLSGASQYTLGVRLAQAMQTLRAGRKSGLPPPIGLKKVTVQTVRGLGVAVVEFDNVVGQLRSGDRPSGFAIVNQNGAANHFDIQLDGPRALVRSTLPVTALGEAALHYGYGTDPYCNITDQAGRSLPVFGPVRMGALRAVTPFVRGLRVSAFQPSAGKLQTLECPAGLEALGMTARSFAQDFCNLHAEIGQRGGADEVVYYACRFACPEAMDLALKLGYDGPVKAWVDGKQLLHDPNGVNPATPAKGSARFAAASGQHEFMVALGTNSGAAWGIFLYLERLGLTKALLLKGPEHYAMPEILG